jgi:hypothetical protein
MTPRIGWRSRGSAVVGSRAGIGLAATARAHARTRGSQRGTGRRRGRQVHANLTTRACLAIVALALAGCGTIQMEAPPGATIRMLEIDEPVRVRDERVVWYALWGGKPLSDTSTADTIARHKLRAVRFSTELTPIDSLVNLFTSLVSIVRRTVVVEGNP